MMTAYLLCWASSSAVAGQPHVLRAAQTATAVHGGRALRAARQHSSSVASPVRVFLLSCLSSGGRGRVGSIFFLRRRLMQYIACTDYVWVC